MAPFIDDDDLTWMHPAGRRIMKYYPIVVSVHSDGSMNVQEILKAHKHRTDTIINDVGQVDTIQFRGWYVPWTIMDGDLRGAGAYFFFSEANPHSLEFKLKYANG